jgi:hypothetical protein
MSLLLIFLVILDVTHRAKTTCHLVVQLGNGTTANELTPVLRTHTYFLTAEIVREYIGVLRH